MNNRPVDDRPILVTGATGFIGLEVCRQLAAAGVATRALVRRRHRAALLAPFDIDLVTGDLASPRSLERATHGCRAVIHLGARATFEPYDRLAPTLVDGTESLVASAVKGGVERIVFGSSLFVHGPDDGPTVDENSATTPGIDYGRAKLHAEEILATGPVSSLSLRLPHVYGWNDLLFGILRSGYLPFPADLDARFPHQHVSDAAACLIAAVDLPTVGARPVADELPVTWRHFFEVIEIYLPTCTIVQIPSTPVRYALRLADRLPLRKPTMLAADTIRGWNLDLAVEPGTMASLGLEPLYPIVDVGIPAVLDSALPYRWRHSVFDRQSA